MVLSARVFTIMWKKIVRENIEMIFIAILIVAPIRYFLIQPFIVHGSSMEPNFYTQDYLIIDELSYRFRQPTRYFLDLQMNMKKNLFLKENIKKDRLRGR